jgi:hypothetical protein
MMLAANINRPKRLDMFILSRVLTAGQIAEG